VGALDPLINAPRPQKLIFGTMLLVILGALAYFFLISGARAERDTLLEENEVRRAEVIKAKADEANLRPFRTQAEVLRRKLDTAKERLPSEREIPQVYRQVSDLALQSGLSVALFQPKLWPVLLLWTPVPFYMLSIAHSGVPIFVPVWWPFSYYNVRYGLELLPAFAVFVALALYFAIQLAQHRAFKFGAAAAVAIFVAGSYTSIWSAPVRCA